MPAFRKEDLRRLCQPFGVRVETVAPVALDGEVVSSTRIRAAVRRGELELASRLLGSPFTLDAPVEALCGPEEEWGEGILQYFPLDFTLPPPGRYRSRVECDGQEIPAVTFIGQDRPQSCRTFFAGASHRRPGEERISVALLSPLELWETDALPADMPAAIASNSF